MYFLVDLHVIHNIANCVPSAIGTQLIPEYSIWVINLSGLKLVFHLPTNIQTFMLAAALPQPVLKQYNNIFMIRLYLYLTVQLN